MEEYIGRKAVPGPRETTAPSADAIDNPHRQVIASLIDGWFVNGGLSIAAAALAFVVAATVCRR